jgi:hypothetical protein
MAKRKATRWNQPTTFSKFLAIMLFILLPLFFFWFGVHYQKAVDDIKYQGALYAIPQDLLQIPTTTPLGSPKF